MVAPALAAGATAVKPGLWWLLKKGSGLLLNNKVQTALGATYLANLIPGMSSGVKDEIIASDLDFRKKDDKGNPVIPKHDLNLYQHIMLGDIAGIFGDTTVEEALTRDTRNRMREKELDKSPDNLIRKIEASTGVDYKLSDSPKAYIAANEPQYKRNLRTERNKALQEDDDFLFYSTRAVNERNRERQDRERRHQLDLAANARAEKEFNAMLAQNRELALQKLEQNQDANRLLQLQLNNDQARHMYGLETQRLDSKGRKTEAVFDSLEALAGLFGI